MHKCGVYCEDSMARACLGMELLGLLKPQGVGDGARIHSDT